MFKKVVLLASVVVAALAMTTSATAAPQGQGAASVRGAECIQAGVAYLKANELVVPVAQGALGSSLGAVIQSHRTDPQLWPWCA